MNFIKNELTLTCSVEIFLWSWWTSIRVWLIAIVTSRFCANALRRTSDSFEGKNAEPISTSVRPSPAIENIAFCPSPLNQSFFRTFYGFRNCSAEDSSLEIYLVPGWLSRIIAPIDPQSSTLFTFSANIHSPRFSTAIFPDISLQLIISVQPFNGLAKK